MTSPTHTATFEVIGGDEPSDELLEALAELLLDLVETDGDAE